MRDVGHIIQGRKNWPNVPPLRATNEQGARLSRLIDYGSGRAPLEKNLVVLSAGPTAPLLMLRLILLDFEIVC